MQHEGGGRKQTRVDAAAHTEIEAGEVPRAGFELCAVMVPIDKKRAYERRDQRYDDGNADTEQRRLHAVSTAGRKFPRPDAGWGLAAA